MANIRRGLERIGKALMMWGLLVSIITLIVISIDIWNFIDGLISFAGSPEGSLSGRIGKARMRRSGPAVGEGLAIGSVIAWAPFLSFKLLFWIGSGFVETDDEDEKPTD